MMNEVTGIDITKVHAEITAGLLSLTQIILVRIQEEDPIHDRAPI